MAIPIMSLVIAALAVFVGPIITLQISKRQIELSRRIAHRQIIAPMRQAWIENLRGKVAELLTLSIPCWNKAAADLSYEPLKDPEYMRILQLSQEIDLLINPAEADHKELVGAIDQIGSSISGGIGRLNDFNTAMDKVRQLGPKIFKTEWNRIKAEIEKP